MGAGSVTKEGAEALLKEIEDAEKLKKELGAGYWEFDPVKLLKTVLGAYAYNVHYVWWHMD